jgi:hypothetical protein
MTKILQHLPRPADLIVDVETTEHEPLDQVRLASLAAAELNLIGDRLVTHFVETLRATGCSWGAIGESLGVTRQAVQQRFDRPASAMPRADEGASDSPSATRSHAGRDTGRRDHKGKYRALWLWLGEQPEPQVNASFAELERILGFPLPASSRTHLPHWYSYEGSAVARAIIDAGWRARNVDLNSQRLTLVRGA